VVDEARSEVEKLKDSARQEGSAAMNGEIAHKVTEEAGKAAEKENFVPEALKKA
jgi:hypothetical protein